MKGIIYEGCGSRASSLYEPQEERFFVGCRQPIGKDLSMSRLCGVIVVLATAFSVQLSEAYEEYEEVRVLRNEIGTMFGTTFTFSNNGGDYTIVSMPGSPPWHWNFGNPVIFNSSAFTRILSIGSEFSYGRQSTEYGSIANLYREEGCLLLSRTITCLLPTCGAWRYEGPHERRRF